MEIDDTLQLDVGTTACPHCGTQVVPGTFACPGRHGATLPTRRKWRAGDGRNVALSLAITLLLFVGVANIGNICEATGNYRVALWFAKQALQGPGPDCSCGTCQIERMREHHERVARIERKMRGDWNPALDRVSK